MFNIILSILNRVQVSSFKDCNHWWVESEVTAPHLVFASLEMWVSEVTADKPWRGGGECEAEHCCTAQLMLRNNCNHKIYFQPGQADIFMLNLLHECLHLVPPAGTAKTCFQTSQWCLASNFLSSEMLITFLCDIGACDVVWTNISSILLPSPSSSHIWRSGLETQTEKEENDWRRVFKNTFQNNSVHSALYRRNQ